MISRILLSLLFISNLFFYANSQKEPLTIDRIFNSNEFSIERFGPSQWLENGDAYTTLEPSKTITGARDIVKYESESQSKSILVDAKNLIPKGKEKPIWIAAYSWSKDEQQLLIFTNTRRVWRANTKGDYYIYQLKTNNLRKLGAKLAEASLMFTKFSPDGKQVAYVSENNLYIEDLATAEIRQLTKDGTDKIINGTFDWVYEEEFSCRDGFRWSPDGKSIAYWQVDASDLRNFFMINNTDSVYSQMIPVQYPKVGEAPSAVKIGVVNLKNGETNWMKIPGDSKQHYLPRLQWLNDHQLLAQQLNRKQNHYKLWNCTANNGGAKLIYEEKEDTWIDIDHPDVTINWVMTDLPMVENGTAFLRQTEKDGWRHIYKIPLDGSAETLLTKGDYDIARMYQVDETNGWLYFNASPDNPTERYLYRVPIDGSGKLEKLTPKTVEGINNYNVSPNAKFAIHSTSNITSPPQTHFIKLPKHKTIETLVANNRYRKKMQELDLPQASFFKVKTEDGVEMDGLIKKPSDFDPAKKYPVLFYVYGEPWGQTAVNGWISMFDAMLVQQGYIIITLDNRGTPSLKGKEWRKSIYRKIGTINSRDQAMAAKEVLKWDFVDPNRISVWGWSGGGSMTLNLLFRYPEIYKTGMSVAPVSYQLYYDNIYQERYMGLPSENMEDFIEGSPITYAKNLEGNLLLIHGTGDDNVHYQNSEALINELIKENKQFQVMPYPNRSHGIWEGENTSRHLYTLLTNYLKMHCPAGGKDVVQKP